MAKRVNNISYKGIRHTPSLVSDADGYASECANLSPDGSDLKPMPMPVMKNGYTVTIGARLVFVHQGVGYENYVEIDNSNTRLFFKDANGMPVYYVDGANDYWSTDDGAVILAIEAVGNTLVVSTKSGVEYIIYQPDVPITGQTNGGSYKPIGQKPPMPVIEFRMHEDDTMHSANISYSGESDLLILGGYEWGSGGIIGDFSYFIEQGKEAEITELAKGAVAKLESEIRNECKFYQPFFVRYAFRLRTGDYIMQSPVVLMLPSTDKCPISLGMSAYSDGHNSNKNYISKFTASAFASKLQYKVNNSVGLSDWSDIIDGIDVFVSEQISNYDQSFNGNTDKIDSIRVNYNSAGEDYHYFNDVIKLDTSTFSLGRRFVDGEISEETITPGNDHWYYKIKAIEEKVLHSNIQSTTLFHKVSFLDTTELQQSGEFKDIPIDSLNNLATLPTLEDDFNSHCAIYSNLMQVYNSRLNMANISQKVFEGFANGTQPQSTNKLYPYKENNVLLFNIIVDAPAFRVKKNGKVITVRNYYDTNVSKLDYCSYLYYPDADCFEAVIYYAYGISSLTYRYFTIPMKRHEYLNGAYWYADMKCLGEYIAERMDGSIVAPTLSTDEERWYDIPNRFMMSATGNPWYFPLQETFDIGLREIRALSINAENMDAPQFGQNPIYVFSADGIWTIGINKDGTHNGLSYVSGDVLSEKWTIGSSPTASAQQTTFFKTSRSIMAVIGSQVKDIGLPMKGRVFNPMRKLLPAVSVIDGIPTIGTESYWLDVINGVCDDLPFADFASSSRLMYDYRNNRLLLYPGTEKIPYLYVYDIAHDFWSKMLPLVINEGPTSPTKDEYNQRDNSKTYTSFISVATIGSKPVLQDNQGHIWYVGEQPDENDIQVRQFGFYVSRPMRFGTDDMKTLTRVVHDQQISSSYEERVAMALYGSRDGNNYYKISTLKGTSYKFFIVVLYTHIYPSSRYAYTAFEWEPRMTDKIR